MGWRRPGYVLLNSFGVSRIFNAISLPKVLQGFGQRLLLHRAVGVPGIAREYKLIVIAFGGQHFGHALVSYDPVVHLVAHHIWIEKVSVSDFHPDA